MSTGATPMSATSEFASGREAVRAAGDSLTALGAVLVLLGLWRTGVVLGLFPEHLNSWWPVTLLVVAAWLVSRGRRAAATTMATIGTALLIIVAVPGEYFWPSLLMVVGALLIIATVRGRRFIDDFAGGSGIAFFSDRDLDVAHGDPTQPVVAVFGESSARLHGPTLPDEVVTCVSVFGSTTLTVPHDVQVEIRPLAVFGDVRAPAPADVPTRGVVRVRGTAVFGDVRIRRE